MKKLLITISATAVLFVACNQTEQKHSENHLTEMKHDSTKNVMMQAMDESMVAMHQAKMTGNADYDFASMMIPHHEGAIVMAEAVIKNGKSSSLINFSKKVIIVQKKEISLLKEFLKTANQHPSKDASAFKKALDASMGPMMEGMDKIKLTNNVDKDFVVLMIPHHQSAVDMAKAYLPYSANSNIRAIAEQILAAQKEEINWLKTQ